MWTGGADDRLRAIFFGWPCGPHHKFLGEIAVAIDKQFVGSSSRHADKPAIRRRNARDFETRVRRSFHRSEILKSKTHVSPGNRRASLVSGRYRRARFRSAESFSFQQTDGPITSDDRWVSA